jgi:hypothetical protein
VDVVNQAVRASLRLVIKGFEFTFYATDLVLEQCFDLVEEVFSHIAVAFEDLFGWLGTVFDWPDILRTHECFVWAFDQVLAVQGDAMKGLKSFAGASLENLHKQVSERFDSAIVSLAGRSINELVAEQPAAPKGTEVVDHNVVLSALLNNADAIKLPESASIKASVGDDMLAQVRVIAENFQGSGKAFSDAESYFQGAFRTSDTFFVDALSGLMAVVKGIALFSLELALRLLNALIDSLSSAISSLAHTLKGVWDIPLVSDLYYWATNGARLSAVGLASLIAGLPATVMYKAIAGHAPFPSEQAVRDFKRIFTADNLRIRVGLASPEQAASVAAAEDQWSTIYAVFGFALSASLMVYGLVESLADLTSLEPPTPSLPGEQTASGEETEAGNRNGLLVETLSWVTLVAEISCGVFSFPGLVRPVPFNCSDSDGFSNCIWAVQCVEIAGDFVATVFVKRLIRFEWYGPAVVPIWGVIHLVLGIVRASLFGGDPAQIVADVFVTLPEMGKFAMLSPVQKASKWLSVPALCCVDVIGNGVAAIANEVVVIRQMQGGSE